MTIHTTAIVSPEAKIGKNVEIGPYSIIGAGVEIGDNTFIDSHVVIEGKTIIGKGNQIFSFASIGKIPQDLKFHGEDTRVIIGDNNKIREYCTIHRGTEASGETRIGNDNLLMAYSHVAHDVVIGNHCILANAATLAGHVTLEDYVIVGGLTPVHQFVKIGSHVMIGGASAINQDLIPFVLAEGNKVNVRGLNLVGLKRRGFTQDEIANLKEAYRVIFRSSLTLNDAINQLREVYPEDKNIKYLIDFIGKCERGITR